jgi:hypothetical protein
MKIYHLAQKLGHTQCTHAQGQTGWTHTFLLIFKGKRAKTPINYLAINVDRLYTAAAVMAVT